MPVAVRFEFYGDVQLNRTLERFAARAEDVSPAWEAMGDRFLDVERRQFDTQGGYGSAGWAPLSPTYAAWKARHYPGQTILRRTDELFRSLTEGPAVRVVRPHDAWFGSDVEHGRPHQRGDGVPQRRPVELPGSEREEWVRLLQRYITTGDVV